MKFIVNNEKKLLLDGMENVVVVISKLYIYI